MRLIFSPRAKADLEEIWTYTAERWGIDQAETYLRQLQAAADAAAEAPQSGRGCDDVRPGYFKRQAGAHVLFYRPEGQTVDIVRILHQRMDFDRHL